MPLKSDIKARWVAALRSGKYKQGIGALRDTDDTYCCLGVLCDIVKDEVGGEWESISEKLTHYNFVTPTAAHSALLPDSVETYVGLETGDVIIVSLAPSHISRPVTAWNDEGRTFAEIADAIEEQL